MKQKSKFIRASVVKAVAGWLCAVLWLALTGGTLAFAQTNVPTLISLAPNTALAGTPGLRITVNGMNFNRLTVVRWNGADRTTDFVSTSMLMFDATAADLATPGTAQVTAFNSGAGGGVSNALPFTITQPLPPTPILTAINPNSATAGGAAFTLTVTGANFINTTVVRWNGANRPTTFVSATQLIAQIPASDIANPGTATVTVFTPPNAAGLGGGSSTNALPFTINQPANPVPTLTSLNPNSATAGGAGFTLAVTGANFISGSAVRWNGVNRPTTFISATQLTAQIPATDIASAGTAQVTVFNPPNTAGAGGGTSNLLPFTINQPGNPVPTLTSLNPNAATAGGAGFVLTVTGVNFINSSVVRWNGTNRPTTFVSATQLTAPIPATDIANAGTASITVFNPPNTAGSGGGTSNALPFTINQPPAPVPTLTSLNPSSATAGGAAFTLTVTGTNFINTSAVLWNGVNRPTTFISATQLTAQIPASDIANAGTAGITVFNPPNAAGGGGASNALSFTITLAPAPLPNITSINPNTANAGGAGFALMVTGTNFINTSVVRWNGADRPTTFISATQLIAQIPASDIANPGTANVSVFNPPNASGGGGTSRTLPFTINQAPNPVPTLTSVTPNPVLVGAPGVTLTLTGTNFVANSVVRWNGANRPTMFVSATQLTAQIPASDLASTGTASITVFNPASTSGGGGLSNALTININNPAPVITSIIPNSVVAGSPAFTLTINGNGFIPASVARWNGAPRPTTFVNGNQLSAQIPATDVPAVGTAQITVANPAPGGGISPGVTFTITPQPLPPPVLTSVAASAVAQGARQVRLTLVGKNFRPGARVVVGQSETNPALMPAPDILVESVNRLNETTIFAIVSVANNAVLNTRAVDVINADNTHTSARGSATTQPLRVQGGTSLGAPLQITTVLIVHPRSGTIITQGEPVFAEAVLGGAGTGTIIGQWLWDGNVFEQFALHFTAGERKLIRTNNQLPTAFLGPHRLEIKITSPNLIQSPPIEVIVNNGTWKLLRLIDPDSGAGFVAERPPHLRWTLVPGAMKYQVGFSSQPFFNTITQWHDVAANEWQVPLDVWTALPFGELWWTVRVVETSGNLRQPAELRRIYRLSPGALKPVSLTTPTDTTVLEWQPVRAAVIYRVTITSDAAGKLVLRRFATANAKIDVKSLADKFQPGVTYYWRVEAYSLKGRLIYTSERYSFVPKAVKTGLLREVEGMAWQMAFANQAASVSVASDLRKQQERVAEIAATKLPPLRRVRGRRASAVPPLGDRLEGASLPPKGGTTNAQTQNLSDIIAARTPQPNQTVTINTPPVAIDFSAPIKPSEVVLVLDDTDYSALAQITERRVAFTPTIPLNNGQHQVILAVGLESIGWFFNVLAAPRATQVDPETQGTDAEKETQPTATANEQATVAATTAPADPNAPAQTPDGSTPTPTVEKEFTYEGSANSQSVSGQEPDTNNLALAMQGRYRNGAWLTEMNGNGLLNSLLSPNPRHVLGRFNDYVLRVGRQSPNSKWGADLRFGMISPLTFQNAEYVSTGFAREGIEASVKTPAGNLGFYRNTNDKGQGEGIGFGFHQQVFGGSYDAPTFTKDPERIKFRLMWLSARDVGGLPLKIGYDDEGNPLTQVDAFATPRVGDSYGAMLSIKLNKSWTWLSEYAITSNNVNRLALDATRQFGRAWRTGFIGTWKKANISLAFRDVSPNYAIPATASLTQLSASDRRGLDFSISRDTPYGNFGAIYQYLQSDFRYDERAHVGLHNITLNWSKQITQTTTENATYSTLLSVGVNQARTTTSNRHIPDIIGLADQRRDGVNVSVTETFQNKWLGTLALTVGGSRNWFRDNVNDHANNLITSLNFSGNWSPRPFFQWNSNLSINWMAGERFSVGGSRTVTTYIQPTFIWARTGLSIIPLVTINRLASQLQLLDPLGARMKTGDMWASNAGGRLAWQLPGRLRFNTLSFEASQAWMRDGLSGMRMNTPRYLFLWTLVQPSKPAPPREEKQAEQPQQQPAQPTQPAQKSGS